MYDSYNDVELFIGGMLEYDAPESQVGPTFQAILAEQLCRLQLGTDFTLNEETNRTHLQKVRLFSKLLSPNAIEHKPSYG